MSENINARSGLFCFQFNKKDLFVVCNVCDQKVEMSVSASFDRGDLDEEVIKNYCHENPAVISFDVYEHGIIASVKEAGLLSNENGKTLAMELFSECFLVMQGVLLQLKGV